MTVANPELLERLPEPKGKALGCWCAPEACHGEICLSWESLGHVRYMCSVNQSD